MKLRIVLWKYFPDANQEFQYWRTLVKESAREPTTSKELVMGYPEFLGWLDESGEGVGGGSLPGEDELKTTIWRLQWPNKFQARLITPTNPGGGLDINDMEMVGKPLAWLVLEEIVGTKNLCYKHVGLFDNIAEVLWTQRGAEKKSAAAGHLLIVLALRQRVARTSP